MSIPIYSPIRILTDRYIDHGVKKGDYGVVLEIYDNDGYEVEFMDDQGNTINCFSVEPDEIEIESNRQ